MSAAIAHNPEAWRAITRKRWWRARRKPYNVGLLVACAAAFNAQLVVLWACESRLRNVEVTIMSLAFLCFLYLFVMAVANVCYNLGPFSERVVRPRDEERFRRTLYALGFWFSVVVPFGVPVATLASCIFHPQVAMTGADER